jgi:hypothetical protein
MLGFYSTNPIVRTGTRIIYPHPDVLSVHRTGSSHQIWWLVNMRNQFKSVVVPAGLVGTVWNERLADTSYNATDSVALGPFQIMLLHRNL